MIPGQLSLLPHDNDVPLLYVASALSHLDETTRGVVEDRCKTINEAAVAAALDDEPPWEIRVHVPVVWSSPWKGDGLTPHQVYDLNSEKVWAAAGMVILGVGGGSLGAGQEFAWACALRIPVLYLQESGKPISRQINGTPADLTVIEYVDTADITSAVHRFVVSRRGALQQHLRRMRDRTTSLARLVSRLNNAWQDLDTARRGAAIAESRLPERRIDRLVNDPYALAAASLEEVAVLCSALGIDAGVEISQQPLPHLEAREISALRVAATEFDWPGALVVDLQRDARMERAQSGIRRFRLYSPEDWQRFARRFDV